MIEKYIVGSVPMVLFETENETNKTNVIRP